jgi:hypothetical protein
VGLIYGVRGWIAAGRGKQVVGWCRKEWPARGPAWFGFFCKIQKEEEKKSKKLKK